MKEKNQIKKQILFICNKIVFFLLLIDRKIIFIIRNNHFEFNRDSLFVFMSSKKSMDTVRNGCSLFFLVFDLISFVSLFIDKNNSRTFSLEFVTHYFVIYWKMMNINWNNKKQTKIYISKLHISPPIPSLNNFCFFSSIYSLFFVVLFQWQTNKIN